MPKWTRKPPSRSFPPNSRGWSRCSKTRPPSVRVRTLHGLKRYLHQRGLRLGFRLVESGRATNRTVTLAVASPRRVLHITRDFEYVNFGSERNTTALTEIPYPVKVVVDGFSRQILHGQQRLPGVRVFCYGNEIHYYLTFLNHPAFLRIDFSPPLRGGMIDLEYYGVSKNELDLHPNICAGCHPAVFPETRI